MIGRLLIFSFAASGKGLALAIAGTVYFTWWRRTSNNLLENGIFLQLPNALWSPYEAEIILFFIGLALLGVGLLAMFLSLWRGSEKYYTLLVFTVAAMQVPVLFPHSRFLVRWLEPGGIAWLEPLGEGIVALLLIASLGFLIWGRSLQQWGAIVGRYYYAAKGERLRSVRLTVLRAVSSFMLLLGACTVVFLGLLVALIGDSFYSSDSFPIPPSVLLLATVVVAAIIFASLFQLSRVVPEARSNAPSDVSELPVEGADN